MNANELAEIQAFKTEELTMWERNHTATMLRQQQAEIESLKKEAALQRLSDFTQDAESFDRTASHMAGQYVSYLKLTDEEIIATVKDHFIGAIKVGIVLTNDNVLEFAKAILRKAQEK